MRSLPLAAIAFLLAAAGPAQAQLDRGTITGTVTDPTGAAIPGTLVIVKHIGTGEAFPLSSNEAGQYTRPNLVSGDYQVTFEAQGFRKLVRSGITLKVTDVQRVDVRLQLGATAESIEVSAEA